jgi:hypothetical protein
VTDDPLPARPEDPRGPGRPVAATPPPSAAPRAGPAPEPTRTLAPEARVLWTLTALGQAVVALLVAGLLGGRYVPDGLRIPVVVLGAAAALIHVVVLPRLRWRRWRYEVREQEIDLMRGAFTVRRTLVPMSRVQHVDTRRTVVSELFGLASVVFHTAAGANEIPALSEADAAHIRDRIAELAATGEDPV